MNVKEALKVLDQVCAETTSNRAGHIAMQQAMDTVSIATAPPTVPPTATKEVNKKKESDGNKSIEFCLLVKGGANLPPLIESSNDMEQYAESIIIRQDNRPHTDTPLMEDDDCDALFEFEGVVKLKQILKSVTNATHNRHDYVFEIVSIDKLEKS